jgi:hypothetical protein
VPDTGFLLYDCLFGFSLRTLAPVDFWSGLFFALGSGFLLLYVFTLATIVTCHLEEMGGGG